MLEYNLDPDIPVGFTALAGVCSLISLKTMKIGILDPRDEWDSFDFLW